MNLVYDFCNVVNNYFHFTVTRGMRRLLDSFGIRDCFVELERCAQAESLCWLTMNENNRNNDSNEPMQQQNTATLRPSRRASIASSNLFVVENHVREYGFDYLQRIPRTNSVNIGHVDHVAHASDTDMAGLDTINATVDTVDGDEYLDNAEYLDETIDSDDFPFSHLIELVIEPLIDPVESDGDEYLDNVEYLDDRNTSAENNGNNFHLDEFVGEVSESKDDETKQNEQNEEGENAIAMLPDVPDNINPLVENEMPANVEVIENDNNSGDTNFYFNEIDDSDDFPYYHLVELVGESEYDELETNEETKEANPAIATDPNIGRPIGDNNDEDDDGGMNLFRGDDSGNMFSNTNGTNDKIIWSNNGNSTNVTSVGRERSRLVLQNDFDPFRRLPNQAFTPRRPRSMSVDARNNGSSAPLVPLSPLLSIRSNHRRRSSSCLSIPNLDSIEEIKEK